MKTVRENTHTVLYLSKKSACKWTHAVKTRVVQRSTVYNFGYTKKSHKAKWYV